MSASTLKVLLIGDDLLIEEEFREALAGIADRWGILYYAETFRQGLDIARDRQPNLIVIDIDFGGDLRELAAFSKDVDRVVPHVVIAAAFRPDRLSPGDSQSATIIDLLRVQVRDFLRRPLSTTELRQVLDRLLSTTAAAQGVNGRIVSFVSNKGGVGKSTLSVNVASELGRRHPGQVLLVDTSLQLGICALMLDLKPTTTVVDAIREEDRLDETLLRRLTLPHASGLRLLAAPVDALEAAEIGDESVSRILTLARRTFELVIVDTFPMLDSIVVTILDLSDVAYVVFQGTAPSIAGAARLLPLLDTLGFAPARQRVVLNQNHKSFLGNLTISDVETRLGRRLDHVVPYDKRVLISMNTGSPYILRAARWRGFGRAVSRLVDRLDNLPVRTVEGRAETGRQEPPPPMTRDRRLGIDRRVRDVGRAEGDRRSGLERRSHGRPVAIELEVTR